jgi:hypothetical protein
MGPIRFIQSALSHPLPAISFSPLSISVAMFAVFRFRRVNYNRLAVNYSYGGVNYRSMGALSATPARGAANVAKGHVCVRPELHKLHHRGERNIDPPPRRYGDK